MAQSAIAYFDYSLGQPILPDTNGLRICLQAVYRDTADGRTRASETLITAVASDATGTQIITALTTTIVDAGTALGFTIPRTSVRVPAFSTGQ